MKSFFKKLAFVMALAMVVTLAAPAAKTAVAAEDKKPLAIAYQKGAAITALNLADLGDEEDLRFVYAPENWKDLEVKWTSTNPNVVSVDNSGVVKAEAAGHAVVTVQVGEEYASIDVYSVDMVKFEATMGTKEERKITEKTIEIGDSFDFAFFGIKDYDVNRYNCQWLLVDPAGVAELDRATGEVTAKAAGTCVLTLLVANTITMQKTPVADCIITIPAAATPVPEKTTFVVDNGTTNVNTTVNTVDVYFSEAYNISNVELYRVFEADDDNVASGLVTEYKNNYAYQNVYVTNKWIDGKNDSHWTIQPYVDFIDGETYEIRVDDLDPVQFTASVGTVAKVVVVETQSAVLEEDYEAAVPALVDVDLYDAKGVLVDNAKYDGIYNNSEEYITYTTENEEDGFYLTINEIDFYRDVTAIVVATYDNGKTVVASEAKSISPIDRDAYGIKEIIAWTIINDSDKDTNIDWKKTTQEMAANDTYRKLVVLFRDTRGQLYTTDYRGVNTSYNGENVLLTLTSEENWEYNNYLYNAEGTPFAANGCYVEFKAMDPDNLLIDVDGGIESYKRTNTRWALYLYNYRIEGSQFDKEVFSATIKVNAPRVMRKIDADSNNFSILLFTEEENAVWQNAYYSVFSTGSVHFDLYDQYGVSWGVDKDNVGTTVEDPYFVVTNLTGVSALDSVFADYQKQLNDGRGVNYSHDGGVWPVADADIDFELNDFIDASKNVDVNGDGSVNLADKLIAGKTITFRVTETVSGVSEKIVISIVEPNEYIKLGNGLKEAQDNAVVREELILKDTYAELFDIKEGGKISVSSAVTHPWFWKNTKGNTTKTLTLYQKDAKGYNVGFENNILISREKPTINAMKQYTIDTDALVYPNGDGSFSTLDGMTDSLRVGTKVLVATMPNGSILDLAVVGNTNAAYSAKEEKIYGSYSYADVTATGSAIHIATGSAVNFGYAAPQKSTGLGLSFNTKNTLAQDKITKTKYNQYMFNFATIDDATHEMYFLPFGTYTATVYTVERVEAVGYWENDIFYNIGDTNKNGLYDAGEDWEYVAIFSGNSLFKQTSKFTFTDDMPEVTLAKRLNATTSVYLGAIDPDDHDEEYVKELIVDNFTFNWNGGLFEGHTRWSGIDTDDILCYTVQKSTNNQIVIKDVVFKVWIDWDNDGDPSDDFWYRSTAAVNLSLTYVEEN